MNDDERTPTGDTLIAGFLVLFLVVFFICAYAYQDAQREACTNRGGAVVEIRDARYGGWFCDEPRR